MSNDNPDYVVVRAAPGLPEGFLPAREEGRWYDRRHFSPSPTEEERLAIAASGIAYYPGAVCVATDRLEVRDDGAVAQVFEVRP